MRRRNISPSLIKSFLTVLRMQSHTKAAQALDLTQPAVTQHISRLEDILNVKLIERSRGAVIPTKEAQVLLPDFERLERSVEMMFEKARAVAEQGQRAVQIATPTSLVSYLLAPVITEMQVNADSVFPVFREVDDFRVYDMVRAGEVDFALTSMTGNDAELSQTLLLQDRPCLVFPTGHELDSTGPITIEKMLTFKFIRPPPGTAANRIVEACQTASGAAFSFAAEASRLMTMEVMARTGLGLAVLPGLSAQLVAHTGLGFRPIEIDSGFRSCNLIRMYRKRLSPAAQNIADGAQARARHLRKEYPDLIV